LRRTVRLGLAVRFSEAVGSINESSRHVAAEDRTEGRRRVARLAWRRPGFLAGVLCGVALVLAGRYAINRTNLADWLVSPLLIADSDGKADAIVVLGAAVIGDCGVNQNGVRRVLLAARLYREHRAPLVFFTGGAADGACPVSVAMAALAREVGIPEASIRVETASLSTRENGERVAPQLRALNVQRVLLVTDRLHMARGVGVFAQLGFDVERASVPIYEGHQDNVSMLAAGVREAAAIAWYRRHGWVIPGLPRSVDQSHARETRGENNNSAGERMSVNVANPKGPLVIHGASYAGGWPLKQVGSMPVVNTGVSGQQSFEMLERFERDVVSKRPRAVIVWGFINDVFRTAPDNMEAALGRVRDSYTRMVAIARANGIEPILATEVTVRPVDTWSEMVMGPIGRLLGKESNTDRINKHVLATNRWLMDYARREGLLLIDLHGTLSEANGQRRKEFALEDGSHIPPAGYTAITAYVTPILEAHFMSQGTAR